MKWIVLGAKGRMGSSVCEILKEKEEAVFEVDKDESSLCAEADIIVDFSTAENREEYVKFAAENKIPYACFSTGLSENDQLLLKNLSQKVPVLVCFNASVGMQAMFELTKLASNLLPNSEIVLQEYHHKKKKDSPSGTAKELLEILIGKNVVTSCYRVGNEVGIHKIQFYLEDEVLEISHRVSSKMTFAAGAVEMAERLTKKEAGLYKKI